jgi:hypothetical protein
MSRPTFVSSWSDQWAKSNRRNGVEHEPGHAFCHSILALKPRGQWPVVGKVTLYQNSASLSRTYLLSKNGGLNDINAQYSRSCRLLSFSAPSGVTKERYVCFASARAGAWTSALPHQEHNNHAYRYRAYSLTHARTRGRLSMYSVTAFNCAAGMFISMAVHFVCLFVRSMRPRQVRLSWLTSTNLLHSEHKAATMQATPSSRTARLSMSTSCVRMSHSLVAISR